MIQILQTIFSIVFGFFIVYLVLLSILALFVHQRKTFPSSRRRRFCIITPAHNEELSVERTVKSILQIEYPKDLFESVVIADNCTDATADIARRTGANVLIRIDNEYRGKGFALRWCFDTLLLSKNTFDAFVVIDADSVPSKNFLEVLNYYMDQGSQVVQATDIVEPQAAVWNSEMTRIGFLLYNYARPLGRMMIHCPTGLRGNGMCFSEQVIRNVPWEAYSIAEDLEFGVHLLLQGYPALFAPEAVVSASMPRQAKHAKSQRARWEGGRFPVIRRFFFPLLYAALHRRSYIFFDACVDLVTPALVNLLVACVAMMCVSAGLELAGVEGMRLFLYIWGGLTVLGFVHMFVGLKAVNADQSAYRALWHLPRYVLWKMSFLTVLFHSAKSGEWIRTQREE